LAATGEMVMMVTMTSDSPVACAKMVAVRVMTATMSSPWHAWKLWFKTNTEFDSFGFGHWLLFQSLKLLQLKCSLANHRRLNYGKK
jgi:hypothetical protein